MNRIKLLRNELGWSQGKLAQKLGVSSQQLMSSYERGETQPSLELWIKMSEIFDADIDYIAGKSDVRKTNSLKDVRMASYNGVDVEGLSEKEIEEIKQFVEFVRNKNKK